jgi:hypothetical protein
MKRDTAFIATPFYAEAKGKQNRRIRMKATARTWDSERKETIKQALSGNKRG